jgi:hypothetical protein
MQKLYGLILVLALVLTPGCAGKRVGATPVAQAAITADAVVLRVNELQATVIDACGPAPQCRPGSLDTALARLIVQTAIDLRSTLKVVPAGWQATVKAAWAQAHPKFAGVTNPVILAAIVSVDVMIGGLQ